MRALTLTGTYLCEMEAADRCHEERAPGDQMAQPSRHLLQILSEMEMANGARSVRYRRDDTFATQTCSVVFTVLATIDQCGENPSTCASTTTRSSLVLLRAANLSCVERLRSGLCLSF